MFIEVIDQLRCTTPHEDSWLVASFTRRDGRFIVEGTLGCPLCYRQYSIRDGVAIFGEAPTDPVSPAATPPDPVATAAFLDAVEGATIVLAGTWATAAAGITAMLPIRIFALNSPSGVEESEHVTLIRSTEGIPLAPSSARGVALDTATTTDRNLTSAIQVLTPDGRLVAPAPTPVPPGIEVLARDDEFWVGQKASAFVPLRRA